MSLAQVQLMVVHPWSQLVVMSLVLRCNILSGYAW